MVIMTAIIGFWRSNIVTDVIARNARQDAARQSHESESREKAAGMRTRRPSIFLISQLTALMIKTKCHLLQ